MPGGLGVGFVEPPGQAKGCRALVGAVWVGAGLSCLCLPQPWRDRPHLQAKSQFKRRSTANNVEIHIPVPNDADSPKFKTTVGSVKWVPENSEIVWSIKSFPVSALLNGMPPSTSTHTPSAPCAHHSAAASNKTQARIPTGGFWEASGEELRG